MSAWRQYPGELLLLLAIPYGVVSHVTTRDEGQAILSMVLFAVLGLLYGVGVGFSGAMRLWWVPVHIVVYVVATFLGFQPEKLHELSGIYYLILPAELVLTCAVTAVLAAMFRADLYSP